MTCGVRQGGRKLTGCFLFSQRLPDGDACLYDRHPLSMALRGGELIYLGQTQAPSRTQSWNLYRYHDSLGPGPEWQIHQGQPEKQDIQQLAAAPMKTSNRNHKERPELRVHS